MADFMLCGLYFNLKNIYSQFQTFHFTACNGNWDVFNLKVKQVKLRTEGKRWRGHTGGYKGGSLRRPTPDTSLDKRSQ